MGGAANTWTFHLRHDVKWHDGSAFTAASSDAVRGRVLDEGRVDEAAAAVRESIGTGPTVGRRIEGSRRALMPYFALLAVLPLGFVLLRRNL